METLKKKTLKTLSALFACLIVLFSTTPLISNAATVRNPADDPLFSRIGSPAENGRTIGDVDGDGDIDQIDATYLLQFVAVQEGKGSITNKIYHLYYSFFRLIGVTNDSTIEFMDIDGKNGVTQVDATILLRYLLARDMYNSSRR